MSSVVKFEQTMKFPAARTGIANYREKPFPETSFVLFLSDPMGSAVKLVDVLVGESPASASFPVGTVVISGGGEGDQTIESPEVNVLVGWMKIWSAPTGGLTKQQVVA